MSDIRAIRSQIKAWPSISDPRRYYVNDWVDRIQHELGTYLASHPGCPSIGLLRKVGIVWYDNEANVHVENVYDRDLARFIAETMECTQFLYHDSGDLVTAGQIIEWGQLTDALPHDLKDQTYFFEYKGETYPVNVTVYCRERDNNKAVRLPDGSIVFDSDSSALWELVIKLIADGETERMSAPLTPSGWQGGREWPKQSETPDPLFGAGLFDDDPERARIMDQEKGSPKRVTKSKSGNGSPSEPRLVLHRMTEEELEQLAREQATGTTHPRTRWTRAEVMDVARRAGVPEEQLAVLSRMSLDEIRSAFLIYDSTDITGNEYNIMQQRHTKFYRLDIDRIRSLGVD